MLSILSSSKRETRIRPSLRLDETLVPLEKNLALRERLAKREHHFDFSMFVLDNGTAI